MTLSRTNGLQLQPLRGTVVVCTWLIGCTNEPLSGLTSIPRDQPRKGPLPDQAEEGYAFSEPQSSQYSGAEREAKDTASAEHLGETSELVEEICRQAIAVRQEVDDLDRMVKSLEQEVADLRAALRIKQAKRQRTRDFITYYNARLSRHLPYRALYGANNSKVLVTARVEL